MTPSDDTIDTLRAQWHITQQGSGVVERLGSALRLSVQPTADRSAYHNAQITDYNPVQRRFVLRPPLRVTVEACLSTPADTVRGTAGFGLWNHTYDPTRRGFRLPQTAWFFFASADSNLALAQGVLGWGWKAAALDAGRWQARALLPLTPLAIPLMRIPPLYRRLYPLAQAVLGVGERALDAALLAQMRRYEILWQRDGLRFSVDGETVFQADHAPRGPLGLIAWIDNQYAVVTPQGQFAFGVCPLAQPQAMTLQRLEVSEP
jgi:hypothetical protein